MGGSHTGESRCLSSAKADVTPYQIAGGELVEYNQKNRMLNQL